MTIYSMFWKSSLIALSAISLHAAALAAPADQTQDNLINKDLLDFNKQFRQPQLVTVAPGVTAAFAYSYSNFTFIEGKTGLILVDTGWFEPGLANALAELRRTTRKPIVAIIITHNHEDHTGGGGLAVESAVPDVPIYAPANFDLQRKYDAGPTRLLIQRRNFAQTGLPLAAIGQQTAGASVGPIPEIGVRREVVPTIMVGAPTDIEIDGVKLRLIPGGSDVSENMMVWYPERRVLMSADIVGGIYPYIETPRYEPRRDPRALVETLSAALALRPQVVIPGHGRLLRGEDDARKTLEANREVVEYTVDQVERRLLEGQSAEEIVHGFHLPPHLASNPDLQPYYHTIDWVLRGLISKRVGYYSELLDLVRADGVTEAGELVELAGGRPAVIDAARAALTRDNPRWAARLARSLLYLNKEDAEAKSLWQDSLLAIAAETKSVNERNYALTEVAESKGVINLDRQLVAGMAEGAASLSNAALLFAFKTRFRAEDVKDGENLCIAVAVGGAPEGFFQVAGSTLRFASSDPCRPAASVDLPRKTLVALYAKSTDWRTAVDRGEVRASGDRQQILRLAQLLS